MSIDVSGMYLFYLIMAILALAMMLLALPTMVHGPQEPAARSKR